MMDLLKYFYWDMSLHWGREEYIAALLRNIPGHLGLSIRRKWYRRKLKASGENLCIYPGAVVLNPAKITCGNYVNIGFFNYIQGGGGITLGSNVLLGPYVKIWSQNHNYKNPSVPILKQGDTYKPVIIGNDVWVGASAFIMPGVVLKDRCVVSANSVVSQRVYPEGTILAGYPARKIGVR